MAVKEATHMIQANAGTGTCPPGSETYPPGCEIPPPDKDFNLQKTSRQLTINRPGGGGGIRLLC